MEPLMLALEALPERFVELVRRAMSRQSSVPDRLLAMDR